MTVHIALLRGVNVGGRNKVPMAELKEALSTRGFGNVRTYIQSGNVVFDAAAPVSELDFAAAIEHRFGFTVAVMIRRPDDLRRVLSNSPFPGAAPTSLHVGFLAWPVETAAVTPEERASFVPEEFAVVGSEVVLHLPNGMGRAKLPGFLDRRLGTKATYRNWATVTALEALAGA